jgi:hypothetical protein
MQYFILIILILGCYHGDHTTESLKYFEFNGEAISVKIPVPQNIKLIEFKDTFMDDSEYYRFTDERNNYTIIIHPNRFGSVNMDKFYLRSEDEILASYRSLCDELTPESFEVLIDTYITTDTLSRSSLRYYTNFRVDSVHTFKIVEFIRSVENKKGWCTVIIRKEYKELNIPEDYKWARSFDVMEMKITKEFLKLNQ